MQSDDEIIAESIKADDSLSPRIPKDTTEPQEIPARLLRTDGGTQHRVRLSKQAIEEYAEAVGLPPIEVVWDGTYYWVVDGHHRVEALKKDGEFGKATIQCLVTKGTLQDARWLSLGANRKHGVRRTSADKRKAVEFALNNFTGKKFTDNYIATQVGVSNKTVTKIRKQLACGPASATVQSVVMDLHKVITGVVASLSSTTGMRWEHRVFDRDGARFFEIFASVVEERAAAEEVLKQAA